MSRYDAFVTCLPGLEPVLEEELREKGIGGELKSVRGGVELTLDLDGLHRANRELGVAQQVRVRIARFPAKKLPALARQAAEVDFTPWLRKDRPLRIRVKSRKSVLYHTGAIAERVLRAVTDQVGAFEEEDGQQLLVRVENNEVEISFDCSGEPLHRRGYRLALAKAPLREDLACALLRVSGWDRTSALVDPMMGSGTIPIEAAMLASGRAPNGGRRFVLDDAPIASKPYVAPESELREVPTIIGSDRDAGAVEAANANAERAGVLADLALSKAPLAGCPGWNEERATLVTNPPFGRRVGASKKLRPLFGAIGAKLRERSKWGAAFVYPDSNLSKMLGVDLESALLTDHGGIKVRFLRKR